MSDEGASSPQLAGYISGKTKQRRQKGRSSPLQSGSSRPIATSPENVRVRKGNLEKWEYHEPSRQNTQNTESPKPMTVGSTHHDSYNSDALQLTQSSATAECTVENQTDSR